MFLRRGFLAATVEEISSEAGYTRGALYKHFDGKEGLWHALINIQVESYLTQLQDALTQAGNRDELISALDPGGTVSDPQAARWAIASAEYLAAVTTTQPKHAAALATLQRRLDEQIVEIVSRHCGRLHIRPAIPLSQLVMALGALGGGLTLRWAIDPAIDMAGITKTFLTTVFPDAEGRGT